MSGPAEEPRCAPRSTDLAGSARGLLLWIIPIIALGITASFGGRYAALSWPPLLAFMGGACLVNARRCGRLHCYFTGPFFLLLAAVALLYGLGVLPLGPKGWQWLMDVLLVGSIALCCIPEWLFGRYRART